MFSEDITNDETHVPCNVPREAGNVMELMQDTGQPQQTHTISSVHHDYNLITTTLSPNTNDGNAP